MENTKTVEEIAQKQESCVLRVRKLFDKDSSVSFLSEKQDFLRKKIIKLQQNPQPPLTRIRIQQNLERLKKSSMYEYACSLEYAFKEDAFEISHRFLAGHTLDKLVDKESKIKPDDVGKLKGKLQLWARIFEKLAKFHSASVLHGNIKPSNILISDVTALDLPQGSQFERTGLKSSDDVYFISLLDGGYQHLLELNRGLFLNEKNMKLKQDSQNAFWLPPEGRGFIEGIYKENSDIFSLSAIMAWDLGMLDFNTQLFTSPQDQDSVLRKLWSILYLPEKNVFYFGGQWHKFLGAGGGGGGRNLVVDTLRKLRELLAKALDPMPEKRLISAIDIANYLVALANKLHEVRETINFDSGCEVIQVHFSSLYKADLFNHFFQIPQKITHFILNKQEENKSSSRYWIEAKNKEANKQQIIRKLCSSFHSTGIQAFCFRVRLSEQGFPFASLNRFFSELISYAQFLNPKIVGILHEFILDLKVQKELILQVIPSLKYIFSDYKKNDQKMREFSLYSKYELLHQSIQILVEKIIKYSSISIIIIDDIQRSDASSLHFFLNMLDNDSKVKWIIGLRNEEAQQITGLAKQLAAYKDNDPTFFSLPEGRTNSWIMRLNRLPPKHSRLLAVLASYPIDLTTDIISFLTQKSLTLEGGIASSYYLGKTDNRDYLQYEDLIGLEEEINNASEKEKQQENAHSDEQEGPLNTNNPASFEVFAADTLKIASDLGVLGESRDYATGSLICHYWDNQTIWVGLSLILNKKVTAELFDCLIQYFSERINENWGWREYTIFSDILLRSQKEQNIYAAYFALNSAIDKMSDIHSAHFLIKKFQLLEEQIEIRHFTHSHALIPKIREKIADLSKLLNNTDVARKYYQSITLNKIHPFTRVAIEIKSCFFSELPNKNVREESFHRILKLISESGFFKKTRNYESSDYLQMIDFQLDRINSLLIQDENIFNEADFLNNINAIKQILKENNFEEQISFIKRNVTYEALSRRVRIFSEFLRLSLGWVDNALIVPQLLKGIDLSIENRDDSNIVHLLFSLVIVLGKNTSLEIRNKIFEVINDLLLRNGSELALTELQLLKAWCGVFFEGDIHESKKSLDSLKGLIKDLPKSLRQSIGKLVLMIDYELNAVKKIKELKTLNPQFLGLLKSLDLSDWKVGQAIYNFQPFIQRNKPSLYDKGQIANILSEKTDQFLLLIFNPMLEDQKEIINYQLEASDKLTRQWIVNDIPASYYLPESILQKLGKQFDRKKGRKKVRFFRNQVFYWEVFIRKIFSFIFKEIHSKQLNKKNEQEKKQFFWSKNVSDLSAIRFEKYSLFDSGKALVFIQSAMECHFYWMAYRLCHMVKLDFFETIKAIPEIASLLEQDIPQDTQQQQNTHVQDGLAISYVIDFVTNFQNKAV
ncbi:MAG: hypothetical protein K2X39_10295, partial [Silvanigrellaceae bacterium]|nr:hypothetical protein [Silvanigrellaceae bacterium]